MSERRAQLAEYRRRYGERLYLLRIRGNLTQPELAEILGVTRDAVSSWERGLKLPRAAMRRQLADYFPGLALLSETEETQS